MKRILLIITLATLALPGCKEDKFRPPIDLGMGEAQLPVQESWDSELYFTEEGVLKAVLYADHIRIYQEPKQKLLDGVTLDFFDEQGLKSSSLTSKHGKVDDATQNMYAIDSVVAVSDSGVTLTTDELMWRKKDGKIITDKFVTIVSENERIEGYGFESDQGLRNYVIFNITYSTNLK